MPNSASKRPVGRPRADGRPQLTREAVFAATAQLIFHHGYGGTSIRRIAAEVDASVASIFNLFPSKEDILNELIAFAASPALNFYDRILALNLPPEVTLYKSLYEEVIAVSSAGDSFPAMFYLPELRQPAFAKAQNMRARMVHHYQALIERGIASGALETAHPAMSAEQAFQLSETCIMAGPEASRLTPEENARVSAKLCLKGLLVDGKEFPKIEKEASAIDLKFILPTIS